MVPVTGLSISQFKCQFNIIHIHTTSNNFIISVATYMHVFKLRLVQF